MKYNLDDLHWQEFEVLAFKILQILIAQDIQFLEGGNDKGRDIVYDDFPDFKEYNEKRQNKEITEKVKDKPNKTWYPRFLNVKERMDVLKEAKGLIIGNTLIEKLSTAYEELVKQSGFAKNRHGFNLKQGWWKPLN